MMASCLADQGHLHPKEVEIVENTNPALAKPRGLIIDLEINLNGTSRSINLFCYFCLLKLIIIRLRLKLRPGDLVLLRGAQPIWQTVAPKNQAALTNKALTLAPRL